MFIVASSHPASPKWTQRWSVALILATGQLVLSRMQIDSQSGCKGPGTDLWPRNEGIESELTNRMIELPFDPIEIRKSKLHGPGGTAAGLPAG